MKLGKEFWTALLWRCKRIDTVLCRKFLTFKLSDMKSYAEKIDIIQRSGINAACVDYEVAKVWVARATAWDRLSPDEKLRDFHAETPTEEFREACRAVVKEMQAELACDYFTFKI